MVSEGLAVLTIKRAAGRKNVPAALGTCPKFVAAFAPDTIWDKISGDFSEAGVVPFMRMPSQRTPHDRSVAIESAALLKSAHGEISQLDRATSHTGG
jgi:hypothetical protein